MIRTDAGAPGTVCIITGANTGIGRAAALELARSGARVFMACRSVEKGQAAARGIEETVPGATVGVLRWTSGSLASVRRAAAEFLDLGLPLHLLINNAGVAGQRGLTTDGFELHFGTNHLGHFLLTSLLLPRLEASAPARIVNVSSTMHHDARGLDFEAVRRSTPTFVGTREYAVSKLANVLFTRELARRLEGTRVTAYAVHPGAVASDVWRRVPWPFRALVTRNMLPNEEGARRILHPALSPDVAGSSGAYFDDYAAREPNPLANDLALARELWERSAGWAGCC